MTVSTPISESVSVCIPLVLTSDSCTSILIITDTVQRAAATRHELEKVEKATELEGNSECQ